MSEESGIHHGDREVVVFRGVRGPTVVAFRDLDCDLRPPQQRVGIIAITRVGREPDADARLEQLVVNAQGLREGLVRRAPETSGGGLVRDRGEDRELVAGDARDDRRVANGVAQAWRDRSQHGVPQARADGVVEILEVIDVEIQHDQSATGRACARELVSEEVAEQRSVGQLGERVEVRQSLEIARAGIRFRL